MCLRAALDHEENTDADAALIVIADVLIKFLKTPVNR